jgi:hypothetical protein
MNPLTRKNTKTPYSPGSIHAVTAVRTGSSTW